MLFFKYLKNKLLKEIGTFADTLFKCVSMNSFVKMAILSFCKILDAIKRFPPILA